MHFSGFPPHPALSLQGRGDPFLKSHMRLEEEAVYAASRRCFMELNDFKALVDKEFGNHLEHATPGNVREFLDRMQMNVLGQELTGRIVLEEHASTYEEVVKDFFAKVLEYPRDEALIQLWLLSFDLIFAAIELQHMDRFRTLFHELGE